MGYLFTAAVWLCEKYIGKASECDDFNNVTLAYEDDSQVRFTRPSLLHPVNNRYKIQTQKVKVNSNTYCLKWTNGVKTEKGIKTQESENDQIDQKQIKTDY